MALAANGPQVQRRLAEQLGCEPPTITLMVRKLEAAGHLARRPSPTDRRATLVELTAQGRSLLARLDQPWTTLAEETVAGISQPTPEQITSLLQGLAGNLRPASNPAALDPPTPM